jgi:hypothetical protein
MPFQHVCTHSLITENAANQGEDCKITWVAERLRSALADMRSVAHTRRNAAEGQNSPAIPLMSG